MVLLYSVLSFKWPRIPIILSGNLSLAPRILSGELRRFVVCREPFQRRLFPTAHIACVSLLRNITLTVGLIRSISPRLRPNADVKQTSNESEALVTCVDERQAATYGDFKMMTREAGAGGGLRALKLDCRVEPLGQCNRTLSFLHSKHQTGTCCRRRHRLPKYDPDLYHCGNLIYDNICFTKLFSLIIQPA